MNDLVLATIELLRIISDPTRFEILQKLKNTKKSAKEIEIEMEISQSYTSQQLKALLNANLISVEKNEDNIKIYSINNSNIYKVINSIQSFVIELEKERFENIKTADKLGILK